MNDDYIVLIATGAAIQIFIYIGMLCSLASGDYYTKKDMIIMMVPLGWVYLGLRYLFKGLKEGCTILRRPPEIEKLRRRRKDLPDPEADMKEAWENIGKDFEAVGNDIKKATEDFKKRWEKGSK